MYYSQRERANSACDVTDTESRPSTVASLFGDPAQFEFLPKNTIGNMDVIPKTASSRWQLADWQEFISMMSAEQMKVKGYFLDGRIVVTELPCHALHETCTAEFRAPFAARDQEAGGTLFDTEGTATYRSGDWSIIVDEQVVPNLGHAASPSLFYETANTQTVASLFERVRQLLTFSENLRYAVAIKLYRSPVPMELAVVALVWEKDGAAAEGHEWIATRCVNFGNRPLTDQEIAQYPVVGAAPNVPAVQFVEEQAGNADATPPLVFRMSRLFNTPGHMAPPNVAAMPDVEVQLALVLRGSVRAMVRDIVRRVWVLDEAQLQQVVAAIPNDPGHEFHGLRVFAVNMLG